jgi:DNA-binding transcriptional ArsR family regulator
MLLAGENTSFEIKAKLFRGFSDPSRLSILESLRSGPCTVGEIVHATSLSQSNASNHLRCLRDCGLVSAKAEGRQVIYRLSDVRIRDLLGLAEMILAEVARGVYECTRYEQP